MNKNDAGVQIFRFGKIIVQLAKSEDLDSSTGAIFRYVLNLTGPLDLSGLILEDTDYTLNGQVFGVSETERETKFLKET